MPLCQQMMDGIELFRCDALLEKQIDSCVGERSPECEHELHFGVIQIVAKLLQRAFQIVSCNRPELEIRHRLLGKPLQDIDAHILAQILDAERGFFGHLAHRS